MSGHTSSWNGRRVLVTGCAEFLGSAVARALLDQGASVAGLIGDRGVGPAFARELFAGTFRLVHGRAEDAARLHAVMAVHEVAAVFHLAPADPFGHDRGTAAILRAARLYHPRVPVVAVRPAGQLRLASADDPAGVPLGIARFGEVFGGGDPDLSRVVPRAVLARLDGERVPAGVIGPVHDFVHVRDAARACLMLAEAVGAAGEPLDVTFRSGWALTDTAMTDHIVTVSTVRPDVPPAGESPANPLNWRPATSFAEAVAETIAWYAEFRSSLSAGMRPERARRAA